MRSLFFILLCLLVSCGQKSSQVNYGVTTRSMLTDMKGEPLKVEEVSEGRGEVLTYQKNEKFQIEEDKVVAGFFTPQGDEKLILYWKHKFKDCKTYQKQLTPPENLHTPPEIELKCPPEGISVVYQQGSSFVSRIIEYAR